MKVICVPFINGLGKTKGCENAPKEILENLGHCFSFSKDFKKQEIEVNLDDPEKGVKEIYKHAFKSFGERVIFLGGDHSVSYPLARAFFDYVQSREEAKEPCLIIFDAHADLMQPVDSKFPTHEEWLRQLVEEGFPPKNILLVGERNSWLDETKFLKEKGIRVLKVEEFSKELEVTCDILMEFASGKELYVSIDIDAVDPAFAPATHYCEPGGFSSRDFLYLIKRISKMKNLRAVDLVEINPMADSEKKITLELATRVLCELLKN